MTTTLIIFLVLCLVLACTFEFVNGFHDTANAVATVIYTNSMKPTTAVVYSGILNFLGVMTGGIAVAMGIVNLLPMEVDKNQPPIINAVKRGGLNFETSDKPIGLKNNSPIVITPYEEMNHHAEDFIAPFSQAITPAYIIKQESAEITNPNAIFAGVVGSFPFLLKNAKNANTRGVKAITQNGFTD